MNIEIHHALRKIEEEYGADVFRMAFFERSWYASAKDRRRAVMSKSIAYQNKDVLFKVLGET